MKRIYNFILLVCLVQLAVAQNRIAEIRENLLGNYSDRVLIAEKLSGRITDKVFELIRTDRLCSASFSLEMVSAIVIMIDALHLRGPCRANHASAALTAK